MGATPVIYTLLVLIAISVSHGAFISNATRVYTHGTTINGVLATNEGRLFVTAKSNNVNGLDVLLELENSFLEQGSNITDSSNVTVIDLTASHPSGGLNGAAGMSLYNGVLYVAERDGDRISSYSLTTGIWEIAIGKTYDGNGVIIYDVSGPVSVHVDEKGITVAEAFGCVVANINKLNISKVLGGTKNQCTPPSLPITTSLIQRPSSVAVSPEGYFAWIDTPGQRITYSLQTLEVASSSYKHYGTGIAESEDSSLPSLNGPRVIVHLHERQFAFCEYSGRRIRIVSTTTTDEVYRHNAPIISLSTFKDHIIFVDSKNALYMLQRICTGDCGNGNCSFISESECRCNDGWTGSQCTELPTPTLSPTTLAPSEPLVDNGKVTYYGGRMIHSSCTPLNTGTCSLEYEASAGQSCTSSSGQTDYITFSHTKKSSTNAVQITVYRSNGWGIYSASFHVRQISFNNHCTCTGVSISNSISGRTALVPTFYNGLTTDDYTLIVPRRSRGQGNVFFKVEEITPIFNVFPSSVTPVFYERCNDCQSAYPNSNNNFGYYFHSWEPSKSIQYEFSIHTQDGDGKSQPLRGSYKFVRGSHDADCFKQTFTASECQEPTRFTRGDFVGGVPSITSFIANVGEVYTTYIHLDPTFWSERNIRIFVIIKPIEETCKEVTVTNDIWENPTDSYTNEFLCRVRNSKINYFDSDLFMTSHEFSNKDVWPFLFIASSGCTGVQTSALTSIGITLYDEDNTNGDDICVNYFVASQSPFAVFLKPDYQYTALIASTSDRRTGAYRYERIAADKMIGCIPRKVGEIDDDDDSSKSTGTSKVVWIVLGVLVGFFVLGGIISGFIT